MPAFPGSYYVPFADLRAMPNLSDEAKFTDVELAAALEWFETKFERYTGVAWEPRTVTDERHYLAAAATLTLNHMYPREITAVRSYTAAATYTEYTADELADLRLDPSGVVSRVSLGRFSSTYGLIAFDYSHGFDAPPADIVDAAKVAVEAKVVADHTSARGDRQFSVQTQDGVARISTPGPKRPFGIPVVDEVANAYIGGIPSAIPGVA